MHKSIGQVVELFISQRETSKRMSKSALEVDTNGIVGDKFYGKDLNRPILLTSISSYKLALEHGIEIPYGALGENILIDYNPYDLEIGTELKIGKITLEVRQNCTLCDHLSVIDKRLPTLLKNDRGIFVKAINAGFIKKSDKVYL